MTKQSPINYTWKMVREDLPSIISTDGETFCSQASYGLERQLKELEKVHRKSGELIHELETVREWLRGNDG